MNCKPSPKLFPRWRALNRLLGLEQQARKEAENANRAKDEFLATVSHELRTPLTAILGWTHIVRTGDMDAATSARAMESIERNARAQAQLIEDLLDVSRIISGKLRLEVRTVNPVAIVAAAMDAVRPAAEAKSVRLAFTHDTFAGTIAGDPDRLQQVVWNLLSNAVKFTPQGGRVDIHLEPSGACLQLTVADTGQGIRPDFLPYVFDRFRQADSTSTRSHGGLGLGLAIVRHLVELHGGTIRAESPGVGQGATFFVTLPLGAALEAPNVSDALAPKATRYLSPPVTLGGVRVLVVEDEDDTRDWICNILARAGADVIPAASASDALVLVERLRPDILVSDIGMPGEDGYGLIRRVRALGPSRGGSLPAIALTAYARIEDRMRVLSAGYQMHVPKPVEASELASLIAGLVGRR